MNKDLILIKNLKKSFDDKKWITNDLDLTIPSGEMTCIIGRSGEGKSVLLKQMIGLIQPSSGSVYVDGVDITKLRENELDFIFKKCGYVFQFAALLDSLTVFENVGLAMLEKGIDRQIVLETVSEKLNLVNLVPEDVLYKYPSELSGGMRKRVGLARTLIPKPKIIFYDEPTTGLDPITAKIVHELMFKIHKNDYPNQTSIIISHDIEIFNYVDNIALLHQGKIQFWGKAANIWESDNPYVYQFIRGLSEGPIQTEIIHQKPNVG